MDIPTLNPVHNGFSNFQSTPSAESGATGQALSRDVEEVAVTLSSVDVGETAADHLQTTVPFHNPFDNPAFEKRSIEIVYRNPEEEQQLNLTVRKESIFLDQQPPTYIPGNESFSIQSILGLGQSTPQSSLVVDHDLHQPEQLSNQDGIGTFSKPESPTVSDELRYTELNAHTVTHPPFQGASCGETSVNISQPSSCPVAIVNPQQEAQTEAESVNPLLTSSKGKAARAQYLKSPAGKAARARANAKYLKSPTGKAARARAKAKYLKSPDGKAVQAIRLARSYAYKTELAKSRNEEIARKKGEEAAESKRLSLQNKSVDQIALPPLFSRLTEGIFTVPIEPISP